MVCIDVTSAFIEYTGGVLNPPGAGCAANQWNHCLTLTGWGEARDSATGKMVPYWNLINDWGADWGLNGAVWLVRGRDCLGVLGYAFDIEV